MEDDEEEPLQDKLISFAKKNFLILALAGGGMLFLGIGLIQMLGQKTASVSFERGVDVAGAATSSSSLAKIKVDVEGEVINPGVYDLNSDARVQDALIAAGGLSSQANRKVINLAQKILDGQKIYVPAVGETASVSISTISNSTQVVSGGSETSNVTSNPTGPISINSGSESELESLPGIGPVTAGKIISARPYGSIEDLVNKKAVGQKTFDKIKDQITL